MAGYGDWPYGMEPYGDPLEGIILTGLAKVVLSIAVLVPEVAELVKLGSVSFVPMVGNNTPQVHDCINLGSIAKKDEIQLGTTKAKTSIGVSTPTTLP